MAAVTDTTAIAVRERKRKPGSGLAEHASYLQALPLLLILGAFLLIPIALIATVSFWDYDFAQMYPDFLTTNYTDTLGSWITWKNSDGPLLVFWLGPHHDVEATSSRLARVIAT